MKILDIDVSIEEFDFLMCEQSKGKELKVVDAKDKYDNPIKKVVAVERVITDEEKKAQRIAELKNLLESTDYQVLKWKEGELTDEQFEPTRLQRKAWREEIRSLGG